MAFVTTVDQWQAFLRQWSNEYLATDHPVPSAVRRARWLGYEPATELQISRVEKRLGYRLPPSYRAFLLTTNGWRQPSAMVGRVRPVGKVEWLEVEDPSLVEAWTAHDDGEPYMGLPADEYFAYDGRPIFDAGHFRGSLKIADSAPGDSAIYVLTPRPPWPSTASGRLGNTPIGFLEPSGIRRSPT